MRKITLLATATLLSIAYMGGQSLTVKAASAKNPQIFRYGKNVIISNGNLNNMGNCNINSILQNLFQCLPSDVPCPPSQMPDIELPDTDTPGTDAPDTDAPDDGEALSYTEQVVALVNAERAKEGLAPLSIDQNVQAAAQVRAQECEQSFSHTRPDGSSFSTSLTQQGVTYSRSGENIAWGQRSPEEVVNAWMNSSSHRANIMDSRFTKIGVGYHQNANGVNYWSQLFIG